MLKINLRLTMYKKSTFTSKLSLQSTCAYSECVITYTSHYAKCWKQHREENKCGTSAVVSADNSEGIIGCNGDCDMRCRLHAQNVEEGMGEGQ